MIILVLKPLIMEELQKSNELLRQQIQETNRRLQGIQSTLVGVLITTGIVALIFIILYTKVSSFGNSYRGF